MLVTADFASLDLIAVHRVNECHRFDGVIEPGFRGLIPAQTIEKVQVRVPSTKGAMGFAAASQLEGIEDLHGIYFIVGVEPAPLLGIAEEADAGAVDLDAEDSPAGHEVVQQKPRGSR